MSDFLELAILDGATPGTLSLPELERVIERGQQTFIEVGRALLEIRDRRLYRETHATFEAYCRERWGWGRSHVYRTMDAARVADALSPMGDTPPSRGLSAPVKAAVACAYYYVPRHELMLFVDRLYSGVITDESESAVIRLRDWLTGSSFLLGGGGGAQEKYLKTARAIQLFHQRKQVSQLFAASRNPFPLPNTEAVTV